MSKGMSKQSIEKMAAAAAASAVKEALKSYQPLLQSQLQLQNLAYFHQLITTRNFRKHLPEDRGVQSNSLHRIDIISLEIRSRYYYYISRQ